MIRVETARLNRSIANVHSGLLSVTTRQVAKDSLFYGLMRWTPDMIGRKQRQ